MNNEILEAALEARGRGWSVMPVSREAGKVPLIKWKEYQERLPDFAEIKKWFRNNPDRNLGIITGSISGVFIVDTDTEEAVEWLESQGVPAGPIAQGSQPYKRHYYFEHPGHPVSNSVKKIHPGADVRGDGGYAVLPPSVHLSGAVYQWIVSPDEVELPPAPEWLCELVRKPEFVPTEPGPLPHLNGSTQAMQKYANAALEAELSLVAHAPDGQKHSQLFKSVANVAEFIPHGLLEEGEVKALFFSAVEGRAEDKRGALKTIEDAINRGKQQPRRLPEAPDYDPKPVRLRGRAARHYVSTGEEVEDSTEEASHPYAFENGRLVFVIEKTSRQGEVVSSSNVVADFSAYILEEVVTEGGEPSYNIAVRAPGRHGALHQVEIGAKAYFDGRQLGAALSAAAGAQFGVRASMEKHLPPALKLLTEEFGRVYKFTRTGWWRCKETQPDRQDCFIIPGREPDDVAIQLPRKLCYRIDPVANLDLGREAFEHFLKSQQVTASTIVAAFLLGAPMSGLMGWDNERYALHVAGRTGSLKSTCTQIAMCLYGPDFIQDNMLLKWGEGATPKSVMGYATHAHDLPMLIDNYKPQTGGGAGTFVGLIHNILEGSDRDRLFKDGTLRDPKSISAWPVSTGEDIAHDDAAALARIFVVRFARERDPGDQVEQIRHVTEAQKLSPHLCALGGAIIEWFESEHAASVADEYRFKWDEARAQWSAMLRSEFPDMVNPLRVASNLATNQITWEVLTHCPAIADIALAYEKQHKLGLKLLAKSMAAHTTQALEAARFLTAIQELLASGRCCLTERLKAIPPDRDSRVIGYYADGKDTGAYLFPKTAMDAALKLLGPGGLNNISDHTLYEQLDEMGARGAGTGDKPTKVVKNHEGKSVRVLHILESALEPPEPPSSGGSE